MARKGSPLIVGVGDDEYVVASDASAIVEHTRQVIYLNDNEMAVLRPTRSAPPRSTTSSSSPVITQLENKLEEYELGGYEHYMLKEIFEQPTAIRNCLRGRAEPAGKPHRPRRIGRPRPGSGPGQAVHHHRPGHGLARGAGRRLPVGRPGQAADRVHLRQRVPLPQPAGGRGDRRAIAISQSGETADTLAALREAKEKGALTLGVVNVVGSTIARETDAGVYLHAGPEIGVASTKAFTCQLAVLTMLAIFIGRRRFMSQGQCQ